MGKTILLAQVATALAAGFEYVLPLILQGPCGREPVYVLEELNALAGVLGRGIDSETLRRQTAEHSLAQLSARIGDAAVLVLLDGVEAAAPEWVDTILRALTMTPRMRVIVTSRKRLAGKTPVHMIEVPPLSTEEAVSFVTHQANALDVDLDAAALLAQLTPAAASYPQSLATLVGQLRDVPLDLLFKLGVPEDTYTPQLVVERALAELDPQVHGTLALLAALGGADIKTALDDLGLELPPGFLSALSTLIACSLTNRSGRSYHVPVVVRAALATIDPETTAKVLGDLVIKWRATMNGPSCPASMAELGARLAAYARENDSWHQISAIAEERFLEKLNVQGHWKQYLLLLRLGIEAASQRNDVPTRLRLTCRLVRKRLQLCELQDARELLESMEGLAPKGETLEAADLLSHRALIERMDGEIAASLDHLEQSSALREKLGDFVGLATMRKLIGNIRLHSKQTAQAWNEYQAALAVLPSGPSKTRVDIEVGLAACTFDQNRCNAAEALCLSALRHCDEIGYRAGRPRIELVLSLVLERRGLLHEAFTRAQAAAEAARTVDHETALKAMFVAQRLNRML
jgi:hypothetical protein